MIYDRIFAFGCSLTQYCWPTWADILIQANGLRGENWGIPGIGNVAIMNRFVEASTIRHQFTERDLILIMWSSPLREDRYYQGRWFMHGNVYTAPYFGKHFFDKFWDDRGAMIESMNAISAVNGLLKSPSYQASIAPMTFFDGFLQEEREGLKEVVDTYGHILTPIQSDMLGFMGGKWKTEKFWKTTGEDYHPMPLEHLRFVEEVVAPKVGVPITDSLREWVHEWHEIALRATAPEDTHWGGITHFVPSAAF